MRCTDRAAHSPALLGRPSAARCLALAALSIVPAIGLGAEEPAPQPAAEARDGRTPPVFYLRDSSKITGFPRLQAIEVQTQYGKLSVPRDDLMRVRFAPRLDPDLRQHIEGLITDLGHEDFDKRKAASSALEAVGPSALDLLRRSAKSSNDEVKHSAEQLIARITDSAAGKKVDAEDALPQVTGTDDEVMTPRMTVKGTVLLDEFIIESRYGELRVRLADLTGVVFRPAGSSSARVDVSAQQQPPAAWVDSRFDVENGQKLKIEASGQVSVRNYGLVCGPDGNREWSGNSFGNFPMLSLVAKIGKRGQPFLVGNGYSGKARSGGRLYLAVVAFSPYPTGASGSFQVKVQAAGGQ